MTGIDSFIGDTVKILLSSSVAAATLGFIFKAFFEKQIQVWLLRAKGELDKELESHKSVLQQSMENHKWRIRRQELFFEREIEAAVKIEDLFNHVMPGFDHPNMDYGDACQNIYENFADTYYTITKYISKYRVFISPEIVNELEQLAQNCQNSQFNFEHESSIPKGKDLELAKHILEKMPKIKDRVFLHLRSKIYDE